MPELIVTAGESDLYFADLDGHRKEEWVTNKGEGTGNRRPVLESRLGFSPIRVAEEVDDTLASLKVFLQSIQSWS